MEISQTASATTRLTSPITCPAIVALRAKILQKMNLWTNHCKGPFWAKEATRFGKCCMTLAWHIVHIGSSPECQSKIKTNMNQDLKAGEFSAFFPPLALESGQSSKSSGWRLSISTWKWLKREVHSLGRHLFCLSVFCQAANDRSP